MFRHGLKLLADGNPDAALQEFEKSLAAASGDRKADSLYNIAVCHVRLGNIDAAVQAIAEAVAIDPGLAGDIRSDGDFAALATNTSFQETLASAERRPPRDEPGSTEFVYRSTYVHEADIVADRLERAGIAFHRSKETMGVRYAMPIASSVGLLPGSWFLVIVAGSDAARARALVRALPVSHDQ